MSSDRIIPSSAIPDVVTFTLMVDGTAMDRKYNVLSIRVLKEINKISFAKIIVKDGDPAKEDFEISNLDLFIPGKEIEILAGYRSQEDSIFKGIIIKHSIKIREHSGSVLVIECKDKAVKMTIDRKNKFFYDKPDSDVIQEIVDTYSLDSDITATQVTHKKLVQHFVTDWDFMLSRADMNGMMVMVDDGKISIKAPDTSLSPALSLTYGANIYEFEAEMDARNQISGVKTKSWSYTNQEIVEMSGAEPSITTPGNISSSDLSSVATSADSELQHGGQLIDQELQAWADAMLMRSRLSKIQGRVSFRGYADIKPGNVITLNGVGERFKGNAFVSGVRQDIGNGEWVTEVQFGLNPTIFLHKEENVMELPASSVIPAIHGLHIGKVAQLQDDPDGEDRILVKIPVIDGQAEGLWSRVACLDAGKERGTFFRPELDDEVIVGFLNDDPRDPVVLGMLNSSTLPAPLKAKDENPQKGYVSREKMQMIFDDEKKVIQIDTPQGNQIILSEDQQSLTITDQNKNKIEMTSSGINIESAGEIKIKAKTDIKLEGVNIEQKASAQLKLEGSAGAEVKTSAQLKAEGSGGVELKSSGITTIKGSLVQIN